MGPKFAIAVGLLAYVFWPTFLGLWDKWSHDPQYSHGMLVPLFSLYLLTKCRVNPARPLSARPLTGFAMLLVAMAAWLVGTGISFLTLEGLSFVLALTSIVVVAGGFRAVRVYAMPLIFLLFMIPLPYQTERMMGAELQNIATIASTFILQCAGQPAIAEGNTILIQDVRLGVVEACSGLRMLVTFGAFSVAAAMLIERHWIVKWIVLLSAVPIALFTNILRITATGMAHIGLHDSEHKTKVLDFIHDFNGWMMMPIGLMFLLFELWLLNRLLIEAPKKPAMTVSSKPTSTTPPANTVTKTGTKPRPISIIRMPAEG
jgi:exosortase